MCSPNRDIWMDYVTMILNDLENKSRYIAIMDDLMIYSSKLAHLELLEDLLRAMIKNGLKLSSKKCQLSRTTFTYMGNDFSIRCKSITITPLKNHTKAIQKIPIQKLLRTARAFVS